MLRFLAMTLLCLTAIWGGNLKADTLKVSLDPKEPLVDESFRVNFEITTEEGTDPVINFNPLNVEVISRSDTGVRTRTTYINGKLSVERTLSVAYEMVAHRVGSAYLRNINVDLNGKKIKHDTFRINVLKTPRKARDILVLAELDKEEAFVGESVVVRYYLYNKAPVASTEIKRFPKLEKFLKRYHQEKVGAERVELNGEIYTRRVIYTAQVYASRPGEIKVDPITLAIQYSKGGASPFDSFGFGGRYGQMRRITVSSKPVSIKIKALPVENVPPSFTGLVGKHSFKLELNKNRFVVNEPIELKLRVVGKGALELYEAPKIFTNPGIEEFETSADLVVNEDFSASKTFLYTYLGREGVSIKDKKIPFTYFDPSSLEFKTEYIDLGEIVIAATTQTVERNDRVTPTPKAEEPTDEIELPSLAPKYFEPFYRLAGTYAYNAFFVAIVLALIALGFVLVLMRKQLSKISSRKPGLLSEVARRGLNYSRLHQLVTRLGNAADMRSSVESSSLSAETKKYLLDLIEKSEAQYKVNGNSESYKVPRKRLKEIAAVLGEG